MNESIFKALKVELSNQVELINNLDNRRTTDILIYMLQLNAFFSIMFASGNLKNEHCQNKNFTLQKFQQLFL